MSKKRSNTLDNTPLQTLQNNMANEFTIVCGLIKGYLWTQEDGKLKYNASQDKDVNRYAPKLQRDRRYQEHS